LDAVASNAIHQHNPHLHQASHPLVTSQSVIFMNGGWGDGDGDDDDDDDDDDGLI